MDALNGERGSVGRRRWDTVWRRHIPAYSSVTCADPTLIVIPSITTTAMSSDSVVVSQFEICVRTTFPKFFLYSRSRYASAALAIGNTAPIAGRSWPGAAQAES